MPTPLIGLAGATLGGAAIQSRSAGKSADAATGAANSSNALQRELYYDEKGERAPWVSAGENMLAIRNAELGMGRAPSFGPAGNRIRMSQNDNGKYIIKNEFGDVTKRFAQKDNARDYMRDHQAGFETSPGFEFQQEQGINAIERMAAARGNRLGGATLKEAGRYATGLASQDYGNYMNRLSGMSGTGQTGAAQQGVLGQNYAGAVGQNNAQAAQARGSSYQAQGNIAGNAINSIGNIYGGAMGGYYGQNPGFGITPYGNPYA